MDINLTLNNVIEHIEDNIFGEVEYIKAAQMLGMSEFHFQRMFSFLAGVSLAEYIRGRKMTLSAFELKKTDKKVIDIAMKYGYDSHSSFTRAFQRFHGVTPSKARNADIEIKVCPKIIFSVDVHGDNDIKFRLEKTEPFKLFGKNEITVPVNDIRAKDIIISYGEKVIKDGTHDMINIAAGFPPGNKERVHLLKGIYFKQSDGSTSFMYGWEVPKRGVDGSFTVIDVPENTWAVFKYSGKHLEALPKIWKYFYISWLPTAEYKIMDTVFIEKETYTDENNMNFHAEVWVPIK